DGAPVEGEADGDDDVPGRVIDDDGGRFDGRPVPGSIGEVVPNGCGVRNGDGVPLGDCGPTVEGDDDGGRVCGVVTPVWASAGAAVTARITSAAASASRPQAFFITVLLRGPDGARTVPGTRRRDVGITASGASNASAGRGGTRRPLGCTARAGSAGRSDRRRRGRRSWRRGSPWPARPSRTWASSR